MEAIPKEIQIYVREDGRSPFSEWLRNLQDVRARAKVRTRLDRLELGNFGDCRSVGEGVQELRIDYGPGYRVYFGQVGSTLVLLLCGGDKTTQTQDVETAKSYWRDYGRR